MEKNKGIVEISDKKCQECTKSQQLIQKYENLITLLKKKAEKSELSQSNKASLGDITTSCPSFSVGNLMNQYKLFLLLGKLQSRRIASSFYLLKYEIEMKRILMGKQFLTIIEKLCDYKKRQAFLKMKLYKVQNHEEFCYQSQYMCNNQTFQDNQQNIRIHKSFNQHEKVSSEGMKFSSHKKNKFSQVQDSIRTDKFNYKSLANDNQDLINSINFSQPLYMIEDSIRSVTIRDSSNLKLKKLYKTIFTLQQKIFAYQNRIKSLQINMQEALARQIKQSTKKTQSLEMVAEEMQQKNQLIAELNQKILMLQEKYRFQTNGILEDQLTQLRKDNERLQKINIKLQNDLRKTKEKLIQTEDLLQKSQKLKLQETQKRKQIEEKTFNLQQLIISFQQKESKFKRLCKKIEKTFQKLKVYEKLQFENSKEGNKNIKKTSSFQRNELQESYRLQLIFVFLYNIDDEDYDFEEHAHFFDEEQLQVLKQLKIKFRELKKSLCNKIDPMDTVIQCAQYGVKEARVRNFQKNHSDNRQDLHVQQNIYCHQNLVDGSIFDVLNDHRQNNSKIDDIPTRTERMNPQKNLTMKLLQMEIEKNKQIEKISELKEKNMYIRNIILNLMKSLQLKQNVLKNQTNGILQLIFDVFQYSEEEKSLIFCNIQQPKQKRFFGLI